MAYKLASKNGRIQGFSPQPAEGQAATTRKAGYPIRATETWAPNETIRQGGYRLADHLAARTPARAKRVLAL